MKKMLLLITACSFAFSGTLYLSVDANPEYELSGNGNSGTADLDPGFSIGYNHGFFQKDAMGLAAGLSYNIVPMESDDGGEVGFLNLYLLPGYMVNEQVKLWAALGLSKATHDADDWDNGTLFGLGMSYKIDDKYSVGLGFTKNMHEQDGVDSEISGLKLFVGYQM